jgi:hypothetical protein
MTTEQQALADMPIWLVILLAVVGGVSGEMWRADKEGARGWPLLRRLALRSGACMICGVSAIMLLYAAGMSIWAAGAFGCLTAMAGADVAIGLYERWAAKRIGVCEVPPRDQRDDAAQHRRAQPQCRQSRRFHCTGRSGLGVDRLRSQCKRSARR